MATEIKQASPRVYIPGRFGDKDSIRQAADIIHQRAEEGYMSPHSVSELRRMARRGNLIMLVAEEDGKEVVVGVGGITQEHRRGLLKRIHAAEFGALATATGYEGNGIGPKITHATVERYTTGALRRLRHTPDLVVFAMASTTNDGSNKMFRRIGGNQIPLESLPEAALSEGTNYNAYDITHLPSTSQKGI